MFEHLRNGSSNVRMYQCFVDKGTFEEKRTQWLLPALPPPCGYIPSPRAPRTTAQSPSHLPPSTPRQLHMRRPHPPIDTVPPPRHTPSTRPTGPTLPSPQEPPFHTHRHHTTSQQAHPPGALREGDTKANSSTYKTYKGKPIATVPRKSVRRQKLYCHSHIPSPLPPPTVPSSSTPS